MEEPTDLNEGPVVSMMPETFDFDVGLVSFKFVNDVFAIDLHREDWETSMGVAVKLDQAATDALLAAVLMLHQVVGLNPTPLN